MGQLITPYKTGNSVKSVEKILEADASGRITIIGDEISKLGYPVDIEGFDNGYNIISGKDVGSDRITVVSAHYDGNGAYDNAGGVAVALKLMEKLRDANYSLNKLRFLFTDKEEEGQLGSKYHLSKAENRENVVRNINIDGCGVGDELVEVKDKYVFWSPLEEGCHTLEFAYLRSDASSFREHGIDDARWYASLSEEDEKELETGERLERYARANGYENTLKEIEELGMREKPETWKRVHNYDDMRGINENDLNSVANALVEIVNGGD